MARSRSRKLLEADKFRATLVALMRLVGIDWTEWEERWLRDESSRPDDYIYTGTEREILNQLVAASRCFSHYAGYSVQELLIPTYSYRKDFDLDDEEFLTELDKNGVTVLPVRRMSRLASLYRCNHDLGRDEIVDGVLQATRARDAVLPDLNDSDPFRRVA